VTDIRAILERLIGERIEIVTEPRARHARVRADRGQIEQVLLNLALNARDAMPHGGRLVIATDDPEPQDGATVTVHRPWVRLTVSDTGAGMSPEVQAHIFEPFYTTKAVGRGTGLGLATVYGIVSQSGGRVDVSSSPGVGTIFRIELPYVDDIGDLERDVSAPPSSRGEETLLLVEDEPAVRRLLAGVLRDRGYRVLEASDGQEGLRVAAVHTGSLHLLITDVVMPGMSGHDLAQRLEHERPAIKVLFISGYSSKANAPLRIPGAGGAFLQKPFGADTLTQKVREILDASRAGEA
jgi:CheY-like chemotaxis protein